jgi:hypothetical protein
MSITQFPWKGPYNCPRSAPGSSSLLLVRSRTVAPCPVPQVGVSRVSCEWDPTGHHVPESDNALVPMEFATTTHASVPAAEPLPTKRKAFHLIHSDVQIADRPQKVCVCLLLQDLVQRCLRSRSSKKPVYFTKDL